MIYLIDVFLQFLIDNLERYLKVILLYLKGNTEKRLFLSQNVILFPMLKKALLSLTHAGSKRKGNEFCPHTVLEPVGILRLYIILDEFGFRYLQSRFFFFYYLN